MDLQSEEFVSKIYKRFVDCLVNYEDIELKRLKTILKLLEENGTLANKPNIPHYYIYYASETSIEQHNNQPQSKRAIPVPSNDEISFIAEYNNGIMRNRDIQFVHSVKRNCCIVVERISPTTVINICNIANDINSNNAEQPKTDANNIWNYWHIMNNLQSISIEDYLHMFNEEYHINGSMPIQSCLHISKSAYKSSIKEVTEQLLLTYFKPSKATLQICNYRSAIYEDTNVPKPTTSNTKAYNPLKNVNTLSNANSVVEEIIATNVKAASSWYYQLLYYIFKKFRPIEINHKNAADKAALETNASTIAEKRRFFGIKISKSAMKFNNNKKLQLLILNLK